MGLGYGGSGQAAMSDRMMRAARLDPQVYEELEHDLTATGQALTVVVVVAVASGIGHALGEILGGHPGAALGGFIAGIVTALLGWAVWSFLAYIIGTKLFGGIATYGELLRTIAFAQSPGVLNILNFIPILGGLLSLVVGLWILAATIIAMRQALDFDTTKAVLTAIVGFFAYIILAAILVAPFAALFAVGRM
jgi:hypothetical protein